MSNTKKLEALIRDAHACLVTKDLAVNKILSGFGAEYYKAIYREAVDKYAEAVAKITAIGMECANHENIAA